MSTIVRAVSPDTIDVSEALDRRAGSCCRDVWSNLGSFHITNPVGVTVPLSKRKHGELVLLTSNHKAGECYNCETIRSLSLAGELL
jgi:hypothetical protein